MAIVKQAVNLMDKEEKGSCYAVKKQQLLHLKVKRQLMIK